MLSASETIPSTARRIPYVLHGSGGYWENPQWMLEFSFVTAPYSAGRDGWLSAWHYLFGTIAPSRIRAQHSMLYSTVAASELTEARAE